MSKTIKELADEFGVSKTAIRKKLTEEFRSKWVETSTANLGANQPQTGLQSVEFYEEEIRELRKLLDQSQQLLLNEQKKNQLLLEIKAEPADWEEEKTRLKKEISSYQKSLSEANRIADNNYVYAVEREQWFWIAGITAVVFLVIILVLIWIHFF